MSRVSTRRDCYRMRQKHVSRRQLTPRIPGRKARTSNCRNCVLLKGLRAAALPASTIHSICDRMWLNRVRRRQILYMEGNKPAHLYFIRAGRVKLVKLHASGREHVAAVLESGDLFGLEAVFDSAYATGAEALTDAELCLASGDELKRLMAEVPGFAVDLTRYLHRQLCRTREQQAWLGVPGASARLAGYILHVSSRDDSTDDVTAPDDLTLRDLGGILGLSPETVCRARSELKVRGIIEMRDSTIRIRDIDSLQRVAGL